MPERMPSFNAICKLLTSSTIFSDRLGALKEAIQPPQLSLRRLRMSLRLHMGLSLDSIVEKGTGEEMVFDLLVRMESETRLVELLNTLAIDNPDNGQLQEELEQYSASFLEQVSELGGLSAITFTRLVQLHQHIQTWEIVISCCQLVSSEIDAHGPEVVVSLTGDKFATVFKWLIVLRYWVYSLTSVEPDQYCLLQFLTYVKESPDALAPSGHPLLTECIETLQTELGCELTVPSPPLPLIDEQADYKVHGYCVIDIAGIDLRTKKLNYSAWVDIQVFAGGQHLTELRTKKELEYSLEPSLPATATSQADGSVPPLQIIQDKLPDWIQQVDDRVLEVCRKIRKSQDSSRLPPSDITIEFCLPGALLIEGVDAWPWQTFYQQQTILGRAHRVVVRSHDRIHNHGQLLRKLSAVPEPLSIEQWKECVDVVKNFQCLKRGDTEQIAQELRQKEHLGLALTCPFCMSQHRAEQKKLLAVLMTAGVPIVVWSRDHKINQLSRMLKTLLTKETLVENERFNFDKLIHEVRERRLKSSKSRLEEHLALWCDEQSRIFELHEMLEQGQMRASKHG